MKSAQDWIRELDLQQHPEGGWFKETYRSALKLPASVLPLQAAERHCATVIYFLLQAPDVSRFHRIAADEHWFFHCGSPLTIHILDSPNASNPPYSQLQLGPDQLQTWVPAGLWFGASVDEASGYALVSCVVAPGFDFTDFELAKRSDLLRLYPAQQTLIQNLS